MSRVNRLLVAAAAAAVAMIPVSASATPSPSPSLNTLLAQPPSGFSELTTSTFHGSFNAHDYAQASGSSKADQIEKTLKEFGFVDGFGKTWIHQTDQHALVEAVMAFSGAKGAKDWMTAAQADDKKDPTYAHSDTVDGIGTYYGGHFKYSSSDTEGDVFSFVKGNDLFIVGFVSTKDDVLALAQSQTKSQFNSAPNETIPSGQWPENANKAGGFGGVAIGFIVGLVIVLAVVAIGFTMMRRRAQMTPAMAGAAGAAGVQMSGDGKYWWDGQTWRDTAAEAPPSAQRSADGALWWDGQTWRPVPGAGAPPPAVPPAG